MTTTGKSIATVMSKTVLVLCLAVVSAAGTAPVHARQILEGPVMIKAFRIEFNNRAIGAVVVVGRNNLNPPPGYTAGQEYWAWTPGAAWRGTFTLVPVNTVPDYYSCNWETFSHSNFDLSRTVPMPSISPEAGDQFYRVQVRSESRWVDQGWMWLINGAARAQKWYGRNLTSDLIGDGTAIRFTSAELPTPGSIDVYLLVPLDVYSASN